MANLRKRVYDLVEVPDSGAPGPKRYDYVDVFLMCLIGLNLVALILETEHQVYIRYAALFDAIETFSVIVFTIEYVVRIAVCTVNPRFADPITGRFRFVLTPLLLVDLISILPYYLPFLIGIDLRFVRAIRFLRFLRVLKLGRYSESVRTLGRVLSSKRSDLALTLIVVTLLVVLSSCAIYFAENGAQPDAFTSIPAAMWWSVATLTTVGYGDIYPVTIIGKLLGALVAVLGVGLFALPAGIIASGFAEQMKNRSNAITVDGFPCPHCGKQINGQESIVADHNELVARSEGNGH